MTWNYCWQKSVQLFEACSAYELNCQTSRKEPPPPPLTVCPCYLCSHNIFRANRETASKVRCFQKLCIFFLIILKLQKRTRIKRYTCNYSGWVRGRKNFVVAMEIFSSFFVFWSSNYNFILQDKLNQWLTWKSKS